jgi:L-threonylcarbamoyladenylate synthase
LNLSCRFRLVLRANAGENRKVKTLRWTVDPARLDTPEAARALDQAAEILRKGGLVALPTETVYGLGANALDAEAVQRIFAAKQRPSWDPVIVHIADLAQLDGLVQDVPEAARKLMEAFWPGPLTLLLPRSAAIHDAVTAGRPLVGVRMPAHPVALELIRRAGVPVAAPSANLFSHISPTTAEHVLADLDGRIDAVLDAGPALHGVESTVMDPGASPMTVYRPGAVTIAQIQETAGPVELFQPAEKHASEPHEALPSPGVGIRHYAPRARLYLLDLPLAEFGEEVARRAADLSGQKLGVLLPDEAMLPAALPGAVVYRWGSWHRPEELAQRLYAGLRWLDAQGAAAIFCPKPAADGVGAALLDRLGKAARPK